MPLNRRRLLAALAAAPVAADAGATIAQDSVSGPSEQALDGAYASASPPALAAAVFDRTGAVWSGVRGVRRSGEVEPAAREDRWHLGSNTKAMTAAVFARLVEQGRASWDMTCAQAFSDLPLDAAWREAPLTRLMQHRAGLTDPSVIGMEWLRTARDDPASLPQQRRVIAARALGTAPAGAPGAFAYGNANYIVVGAAIEAITGQAWEDVVRAELFVPLGIASGGFGPPPDPGHWGHRAGGLAMPPDHPGADNPLALGPAGTAHMTLADYGRFLGVFLGGGDGWLSADSIAHLSTPPQDAGPAYALGWIVRDGRLAHEGSNTMWHALAIVDPAKGRALAAVSNDGDAGRRAVQSVGQVLARITFA